MSGIPEIDLADWKANTAYCEYCEDDDVIKWFWETLEEFSQQERVLMLQFVTGRYNDFICDLLNPIAVRMARTQMSFGHSDCSRVN